MQLEKAVFYYVIGVYIRRSKEKNKPKSRRNIIFLFILLFISYAIGTIIRYHDATIYVHGVTGAKFQLFEIFITVIIAPICSISWFKIFDSINIGVNNKVNQIAATTFGIYLIHESTVGRVLFFYNIFNVDTFQYYSSLFPMLAIVTVLTIFSLCSLIDMIRLKYISKHQEKILLKIKKIFCSN